MIYNVPTQNALTKTLSAQLLAGATSASLSDVVGIPNDYFIMVVDRVDSNNQSTASKREYIECSGTSGSTVTITQRGLGVSTDQNHAVGAIVEFVFDVVQAKAIKDTFETEHNATGTHKSATVTTLKATGSEINTGTEDAKIVTPKAIADSTIAKVQATASDNVTGTDNTKYITSLANVPAFNSSMARQAIINGNFDIWQRGTSYNSGYSDTVSYYLADRWFDYADDDGGTKPTLTRSRQLLTSGDISQSFYCSRLNTNGSGTSLGGNSLHYLETKIENGVRFLCGVGKKVTISFWARSSIANKKLGFYINQNYGTGGSPSTIEAINGNNVTLTSTWTKYTQTFTTNTLVGKTFGTANDDFIEFRFVYIWGSSGANATRVNSAGVGETYVGSGDIDIAQVQLCAGDVALPFMPKSFEEELRACQRYYEKSYDYSVVPGTATAIGDLSFIAANADHAIGACPFKVTKRIIPTLTCYSPGGASGKIQIWSGGADITVTSTANNLGNNYLGRISTTGGYTANSLYSFHWTAEAEL